MKPSHTLLRQRSQQVREGAGVRLNRAFGYHQLPHFDPFLMLDDFRSENPSDYIRGFPWHPHRGIETITIMLSGSVEHADSTGNKGIIGPGGVQWMTAGSGIIHQEMPKPGPDGRMGGFQLWLNLRAASKMCPPAYQEFDSGQIPLTHPSPGTAARVICGHIGNTSGPVHTADPDLVCLDASMNPGSVWLYDLTRGTIAAIYVYGGRGKCNETEISDHDLLLLGAGRITLQNTGEESFRFLLLGGTPLGEPVSWYGPMVMNTDEEIEQALNEYENGTFLKHAFGNPS